jgi:tetratricopeptide (TPR) repeat protein
MSKRKSAAIPVDSKPSGFPWWMLRVGIVVLLLFFYGKTREFAFTLDDDIFYQKHQSVQEGLAGISDIFTHGSMEKFDGTTGLQPYRPITLLSFVLERVRFNNDPSASHWVNVFLYIALLLVLLQVLIQLFGDKSGPWITAVLLIYLLHPTHVEVVASVKSRDELLAALFGFLAWNSYLKSNEKKYASIIHWMIPALWLMLALHSKESAIVFLAILPLSVWQLKGLAFKKTAIQAMPLLTVTIFFLFVRHQIVGTVSAGRGIAELDNVLHQARNFGELWATKMSILWQYLYMLVWPWPLRWDYSFAQMQVVGWGSVNAWLGLLSHLGLLALAVVRFRTWPVVSFGILFYLASSAPTNNLFFLNGATVAERFLFVPTFGYALLLGWVVFEGMNRIRPGLLTTKSSWMITGLVGLVYAGMVYQRVPDWSSNMSLFETGVKASPLSSKANQAYATELENRAREARTADEHKEFTQKAIVYFKKSIDILPTNADACLKLGQIYDMENQKDSAIYFYQQSVRSKPAYYMAWGNLGTIYAARQQFDMALDFFRQAYRADSTQELTLMNLMVVHFNKRQQDSVRYYGNKALELGYDQPKIRQLMQ